MHEFAYADRILQTVLEQMNKSGKRRVGLVSVEVGELLGLSSESLNMAYAVLSKETAASGSRLKVKLMRSSVVCPKCGYEGRATRPSGHEVEVVAACPKCGAPTKIARGNEVKILDIL